ncbi:MAG: hypothetical protein M1530_02160 [Candidatus Marsarchaeota archaeon]|nr:hypothetical protein [Candidatus Marsarchaeota archaeon]
MSSNFKTERVAAGVNLARNVTASQTPGQKFFEKMYGPAEVQRFAKQNPEEFKAIMREMALFLGFSVNTRTPLIDSISKTGAGAGTLTVVGNGELIVPNAEKLFTKKQLGASNALFVINPSICTINNGSVSISGEFTPQMRQFIQFIENLPTSEGWYAGVDRDGWYVGADGVPKGASSERSDEQALYLYLLRKFGSFWRSYNDFDGRVSIVVGARLDSRGGVLVPAGPTNKELVVAAEKELGGKVGPAARAAFDALLEQG